LLSRDRRYRGRLPLLPQHHFAAAVEAKHATEQIQASRSTENAERGGSRLDHRPARGAEGCKQRDRALRKNRLLAIWWAVSPVDRRSQMDDATWQGMFAANLNSTFHILVWLARDGGKDVTGSDSRLPARTVKTSFHFGNYSNSSTAQFSLHVNIHEISCE
jgi:hypothetical protein